VSRGIARGHVTSSALELAITAIRWKIPSADPVIFSGAEVAGTFSAPEKVTMSFTEARGLMTWKSERAGETDKTVRGADEDETPLGPATVSSIDYAVEGASTAHGSTSASTDP
jgi:hypothetical protein